MIKCTCPILILTKNWVACFDAILTILAISDGIFFWFYEESNHVPSHIKFILDWLTRQIGKQYGAQLIVFFCWGSKSIIIMFKQPSKCTEHSIIGILDDLFLATVIQTAFKENSWTLDELINSIFHVSSLHYTGILTAVWYLFIGYIGWCIQNICSYICMFSLLENNHAFPFKKKKKTIMHLRVFW